MCMLTHITTIRSLGKVNVTICNNQAEFMPHASGGSLCIIYSYTTLWSAIVHVVGLLQHKTSKAVDHGFVPQAALIAIKMTKLVAPPCGSCIARLH